MILNEEIYFDITLKGKKSEIKKFAKFIKSDELEDFLESAADFINYSDEYAAAGDDESVEMYFINDDFGIEADEFDTDDFLDVFCKAARDLEVVGHLYDINDEEFNFTSEAGSADYADSSRVARFNDELDDAAFAEEYEDEE